MLDINSLPKFSRLSLIGLISLALLMTSSASSWGQSKQGDRKAPQKTANSRASEQDTGLIISPDRKSAKILPGFVFKKIAPDEAIISSVSSLRANFKVIARCSCDPPAGEQPSQNPTCVVTKIAGEQIVTCSKSGCSTSCTLLTIVTPITK